MRNPSFHALLRSNMLFRMKDHAESNITDDTFNDRTKHYPLGTPDTKEAYWIRQLFEGHFPSEAAAKTAVR